VSGGRLPGLRPMALLSTGLPAAALPSTALPPAGHPSTAVHVASLRLPAQAVASPLARSFVRGVLGEWRLAQAVEVAELLTSELVGNAIGACAGDRPPACVQVALTASRGRLLIEVTDPDPRPPVPREPDADEEGGRGLMLVDCLADRWGHRPARGACGGPRGKTVWFEIAAAAPQTAASLPLRPPAQRTPPGQGDRRTPPPDLALLARVRRCLHGL